MSDSIRRKISCLQDSDNQTLSISGNQLSISNGNTVTIPTSNPTLNVTVEDIHEELYFGKSTNGTTPSATRNMTLTRTAVGRWTVVLTPPHINGVSYHISITPEEQLANRDGVIPQIVQGTQTASGFDFMFVTGDNGGTADSFVDTPFTIGINSPRQVVTGVNIV